MTPPEAPNVGTTANAGHKPPAVSLCPLETCPLETLRKRADFLRASRAAHTPSAGFVLQMRKRQPHEADSDLIRIGFTCSKKVGNAVARNRAKRRLREIARLTLPRHGKAGHDYVLIGRRDATANLPFERLQADFVKALEKVHRARE